jgi:hypothetical protein
MISLYANVGSELGTGVAVRQKRGRQHLSDYIPTQFAPKLMALAFSFECLRSYLEKANSPAGGALKQTEDRLADLFESVRQNLVKQQ